MVENLVSLLPRCLRSGGRLLLQGFVLEVGGLRFGVWGLEFEFRGVRCGGWNLGFGVWGVRFGV